ncbi:MAG: hypothetical protein IPH44_21300 [Myxococcales bacterium]|nr:hypothetical protein [Myxococcales bacterium]
MTIVSRNGARRQPQRRRQVADPQLALVSRRRWGTDDEAQDHLAAAPQPLTERSHTTASGTVAARTCADQVGKMNVWPSASL